MSIASRKRSIPILLVLACLAIFAAVPPLAHATTPTAVPTTGSPFRNAIITTGVPRFEPGACKFTFAQDQEVGKTVVCGTAVVPETHSQPNNGRTLRLPVAVYKAISPTPAPEPIIMLTGGPGNPAQVFASTLTGPLYQTYTANNDVIIFDQRGVGYAEPNLDCTNVGDNTRLPIAAQQFHALDILQTVLAAYLACRDTLTAKGANLKAFTTPENAADVNDIRAVLGYAKMNIYGGSYGSELGLEIIKDFPQFTRSAALESIVPHQVPFFFSEAPAFDYDLKTIAQACKADTTCSGLNPDVIASYQKAVARLDANPAQITVNGPNGQTATIPVDGQTFTALLFNLAYSTDVVPILPDFIAKVQNGDYALLSLLIQQLSTVTSSLIAHGMHFSVECPHDASDARLASYLAAEKNVLPEIRAALDLPSSIYNKLCAQWPTKGTVADADAPVSSSVPTLLLNNQFDPITPPYYGTAAQQTLSKSYNIIVPGGAHVSSYSSAPRNPYGACARAIIIGFINNPTIAPDTTCATQLKPVFVAIPQLPTTPTPGTVTPGTTPVPTTTTVPATSVAPETTAPVTEETPTPTMSIPGLPNTGHAKTDVPQGSVDPLPLFALALVLGAGALTTTSVIRRKRSS